MLPALLQAGAAVLLFLSTLFISQGTGGLWAPLRRGIEWGGRVALGPGDASARNGAGGIKNDQQDFKYVEARYELPYELFSSGDHPISPSHNTSAGEDAASPRLKHAYGLFAAQASTVDLARADAACWYSPLATATTTHTAPVANTTTTTTTTTTTLLCADRIWSDAHVIRPTDVQHALALASDLAAHSDCARWSVRPTPSFGVFIDAQGERRALVVGCEARSNTTTTPVPPLPTPTTKSCDCPPVDCPERPCPACRCDAHPSLSNTIDAEILLAQVYKAQRDWASSVRGYLEGKLGLSNPFDKHLADATRLVSPKIAQDGWARFRWSQWDVPREPWCERAGRAVCDVVKRVARENVWWAWMWGVFVVIVLNYGKTPRPLHLRLSLLGMISITARLFTWRGEQVIFQALAYVAGFTPYNIILVLAFASYAYRQAIVAWTKDKLDRAMRTRVGVILLHTYGHIKVVFLVLSHWLAILKQEVKLSLAAAHERSETFIHFGEEEDGSDPHMVNRSTLSSPLSIVPLWKDGAAEMSDSEVDDLEAVEQDVALDATERQGKLEVSPVAELGHTALELPEDMVGAPPPPISSLQTRPVEVVNTILTNTGMAVAPNAIAAGPSKDVATGLAFIELPETSLKDAATIVSSILTSPTPSPSKAGKERRSASTVEPAPLMVNASVQVGPASVPSPEVGVKPAQSAPISGAALYPHRGRQRSICQTPTPASSKVVDAKATKIMLVNPSSTPPASSSRAILPVSEVASAQHPSASPIASPGPDQHSGHDNVRLSARILLTARARGKRPVHSGFFCIDTSEDEHELPSFVSSDNTLDVDVEHFQSEGEAEMSSPALAPAHLYFTPTAGSHRIIPQDWPKSAKATPDVDTLSLRAVASGPTTYDPEDDSLLALDQDGMDKPVGEFIIDLVLSDALATTRLDGASTPHPQVQPSPIPAQPEQKRLEETSGPLLAMSACLSLAEQLQHTQTTFAWRLEAVHSINNAVAEFSERHKIAASAERPFDESMTSTSVTPMPADSSSHPVLNEQAYTDYAHSTLQSTTTSPTASVADAEESQHDSTDSAMQDVQADDRTSADSKLSLLMDSIRISSPDDPVEDEQMGDDLSGSSLDPVNDIDMGHIDENPSSIWNGVTATPDHAMGAEHNPSSLGHFFQDQAQMGWSDTQAALAAVALDPLATGPQQSQATIHVDVPMLQRDLQAETEPRSHQPMAFVSPTDHLQGPLPDRSSPGEDSTVGLAPGGSLRGIIAQFAATPGIANQEVLMAAANSQWMVDIDQHASSSAGPVNHDAINGSLREFVHGVQPSIPSPASPTAPNVMPVVPPGITLGELVNSIAGSEADVEMPLQAQRIIRDLPPRRLRAARLVLALPLPPNTPYPPTTPTANPATEAPRRQQAREAVTFRPLAPAEEEQAINERPASPPIHSARTAASLTLPPPADGHMRETDHTPAAAGSPEDVRTDTTPNASGTRSEVASASTNVTPGSDQVGSQAASNQPPPVASTDVPAPSQAANTARPAARASPDSLFMDRKRSAKHSPRRADTSSATGSGSNSTERRRVESETAGPPGVTAASSADSEGRSVGTPADFSALSLVGPQSVGGLRRIDDRALGVASPLVEAPNTANEACTAPQPIRILIPAPVGREENAIESTAMDTVAELSPEEAAWREMDALMASREGTGHLEPEGRLPQQTPQVRAGRTLESGHTGHTPGEQAAPVPAHQAGDRGEGENMQVQATGHPQVTAAPAVAANQVPGATLPLPNLPAEITQKWNKVTNSDKGVHPHALRLDQTAFKEAYLNPVLGAPIRKLTQKAMAYDKDLDVDELCKFWAAVEGLDSQPPQADDKAGVFRAAWGLVYYVKVLHDKKFATIPDALARVAEGPLTRLEQVIAGLPERRTVGLAAKWRRKHGPGDPERTNLPRQNTKQ